MADEIKAAVKVKKNDMVTVYGAVANKFMQTGKPYKVHRELAKKLIEKGAAAGTKAEAEKATKDK